MVKFFYFIEIASAVLLILLVLAHSPKGGGIAGMGSMNQLFSSPKGAEAGLNKITAIVAGVFILTTLLLSFNVIK